MNLYQKLKSFRRNINDHHEDRHPRECDDIMHRNKMIEEMEPYQYQYMFHINNLRKMQGEDIITKHCEPQYILQDNSAN